VRRDRLVLGALLVLASAGCGEPCSGSRTVIRVGSGRYAQTFAHMGDVPETNPPGELVVDRDAGTVVFTRVIDGGRYVARYRITSP
jgi:hypothetical protein